MFGCFHVGNTFLRHVGRVLILVKSEAGGGYRPLGVLVEFNDLRCHRVSQEVLINNVWYIMPCNTGCFFIVRNTGCCWLLGVQAAPAVRGVLQRRMFPNVWNTGCS